MELIIVNQHQHKQDRLPWIKSKNVSIYKRIELIETNPAKSSTSVVIFARGNVFGNVSKIKQILA